MCQTFKSDISFRITAKCIVSWTVYSKNFKENDTRGTWLQIVRNERKFIINEISFKNNKQTNYKWTKANVETSPSWKKYSKGMVIKRLTKQKGNKIYPLENTKGESLHKLTGNIFDLYVTDWIKGPNIPHLCLEKNMLLIFPSHFIFSATSHSGAKFPFVRWQRTFPV